MSVSAQPPGAALPCDKSESTPQVASQHSKGKKNRQVPTTTMAEKARRPMGLEKEGPLSRKSQCGAQGCQSRGILLKWQNQMDQT